MENLVPLGTGNSRFMKSNIPANTTLAQLIQMLNNGTFPYDVGTINPAGISQQGTPLNKDTLLKDATAALYGLGTDAVPDSLFQILSASALLASNTIVGWETEETKSIGASEINAVGAGYAFLTTPTINEDGTFSTDGGTACTGASYGTTGSVATSGETSFASFIQNHNPVAIFAYYVPNSDKTLLYVYKYSGGGITSSSSSAGYNYIYFTEAINEYLFKEKITGPTTQQEYYLTNILGEEVSVGPQIATGSYTGTGTYGISNPNTLTFPFEPKLVIVTGRTNTNSDYQSMGIFVQGAQWTFGAGAGTALNTTVFSGNNGANQITWNGNTISWYTLCTATTGNYRPAAQLNSSGRTYYYIAIG